MFVNIFCFNIILPTDSFFLLQFSAWKRSGPRGTPQTVHLFIDCGCFTRAEKEARSGGAFF